MCSNLPTIVAVILLTVACSGSKGSGPSDSPPPPPSSPSPPTPPSLVAGRVVSNPGGQGIGGATLEVQGASATTDASGNFSLPAASQDRKVMVSAGGFLARETWLRGGSRSTVTIDVISTAEPFSLDFYRTIARGAASIALQPLRRWDSNPSFYIKATDQDDKEVSGAFVDLVERTIRQSVPLLTDGHLNVDRLERGSSARPLTKGWINIDLTTDPNYTNCGEALVGANPGRLLINASARNRCGAEIPSPACIGHEVGHAMGLWHTAPPTLMQPIPGTAGAPCSSGDPTAKERFHAGILYSRPSDNVDTDVDPGSFRLLMPTETAEPVLASCPLR